MTDYSAERGDPKSDVCSKPAGVYSLLFDAYYLKLMVSGSVTQAWHARSGRKNTAGLFDYSVANQKAPNIGPIPEGNYWIQPDQLASRASWEIWRVTWPVGSWGNHRITIHPRPGTMTYGRGGMFIHGGADWGSAGCIDLTYGIDSFAAKIRPMSACYIPLTVAYNGTSTLPPP
ncbi:MAG TPA: tlde1 domain-containing protein [Polyangiaceae bacterium]|nr:tlde1 domain-containing protein [Polyangiaceae bacterium]